VQSNSVNFNTWTFSTSQKFDGLCPVQGELRFRPVIFTKTEVTELQVVCLRRLGCTEIRNAYKTLVRKSEDKRSFRKPICIFVYYLFILLINFVQRRCQCTYFKFQYWLGRNVGASGRFVTVVTIPGMCLQRSSLEVYLTTLSTIVVSYCGQRQRMWGWSVFGPRFEPGPSRIRRMSATLNVDGSEILEKS